MNLPGPFLLGFLFGPNTLFLPFSSLYGTRFMHGSFDFIPTFVTEPKRGMD